MISLVINSKCNQKCEYCFAYDTLHDNNTFMSLETCEEVLKFQSKAIDFRLKDNVGIIGGEPTLHPQFDKILELFNEYSKRYFFNTMLFTNGTHLLDYKIPDRMNLVGLINVNHPDIVGADNFNRTCMAIEKYVGFYETFSIGVNIYPSLKDYDFIFDIAEKYHIRAIRFAIICPDGIFKHLADDKERYFKDNVDAFISFCKNAIKKNVKLVPDCCIIPLCYFNKEQKEIVKRACTFYPTLNHAVSLCADHIDIHPDLTATHCFIRPETIHLRDFKSPDELCNYMRTNWIDTLHNGMKYGKCSKCRSFDNNECNGGCLRFSKKELNNG